MLVFFVIVLEGVCTDVLKHGLHLLLQGSLGLDGLLGSLVVRVGCSSIGEGGGSVLVGVGRHVDRCECVICTGWSHKRGRNCKDLLEELGDQVGDGLEAGLDLRCGLNGGGFLK